ncbi:MAG: hypothetical protein ACREBJ_08390 [Nitrosotalea sp.]
MSCILGITGDYKMVTLGDEIGYGKDWSPLKIDIELVQKTIKEASALHEVDDPNTADAFSKKVLTVADHLSADLTRLRMYYTSLRSEAKDRFNDVKQSAVDEKSDAGKERVALCDTEFRRLRDEYKKAELLVSHLEIKYKELISYHYSFKETARRLSGLKSATGSGSDSIREDSGFGVSSIPLNMGEQGTEAKKDSEPF